MKESEIKKIISKSTLKTSDDFINTLMDTIKKEQEVKETSFWWSFKPVLIACTILIVLITFFLYKFLNSDISFFNSIIEIPKTPVFVLTTLTFLYFVNALIRLNENRIDSKKRVPSF